MSIDSLGMNRELLRLTGMSSGLDTDSIVNSLLKIEQFKVDRQFQKKTKLEWKRDAFRDINLMLRNFREDNMSVLKPENNMLSKSAYEKFKTTMINSTGAVNVTAGNSSFPGTYTIDEITQLAEAAKVESVSIFNPDTISLDTALKDLDLVTPLTFEDNEIKFSINGEEFTFGEDALLSKVIADVNASSAGVSMTFSGLKRGFTIMANETGASSEVNIVNMKGNAFAAVDSAFGIAEGVVNGQDAKLKIENIDVTRSTNSFTIDGISYSLKYTSDTPISFNVEKDVDSIYDGVKTFIDSYNELVEKLQEKIDEPVYRSYQPLTDEQREGLTETEAKKWDEMSKSGVLNNDTSIEGLLNALRGSFYTKIEGIGKTPADIGLETGKWYEHGKIVINEEKLRAAIENNPQEVSDIFTQTSDEENITDEHNASGIVTRISNLFSQYADNVRYNTIANTETDINRAITRLKEMNVAMAEKEETLYSKFAAMETALARMNSQSSAIMAQMGFTQQQ